MKAQKTILLILGLMLATAGNLRAVLGPGTQNLSGPKAVNAGDHFTLVFRVTNTGVTTTGSVLASLGYSLISGSVTVTALSAPSAMNLSPLAEGDFAFTFTATGCGRIVFSGSAAGSDWVSGAVASDPAFWTLDVNCPAPGPTAVTFGQGTAKIPNNMFKPYKDGPLKLAFTVPEAGTVSVKIYDRNGKYIYGRDVDVPAGSGEILWDGRNSSGDVAATGIYIAQFQGKGLRKTLKFAVVK